MHTKAFFRKLDLIAVGNNTFIFKSLPILGKPSLGGMHKASYFLIQPLPQKDAWGLFFQHPTEHVTILMHIFRNVSELHSCFKLVAEQMWGMHQ